MKRNLVQLCAFVALGIGVLTACGDGEAVSATRVSVGAGPTTTSTAPETTTAQPVEAAAPKAAAQPANPATPPRSTTPPTSTKTSAPATTTPVSIVEPVKLAVATNPKLGRILVDGKGRTLYRLDADNVKPVRSTCVDDCAKRFPPLLVPANGTVTAEGVDAKLIGRITRPDNTIQVTFGGRPMYRYAGDAAAGDTLGQGITGGKVVNVA
jgi:predicted lipoprotein with Yx(FWY)xxD motif